MWFLWKSDVKKILKSTAYILSPSSLQTITPIIKAQALGLVSCLFVDVFVKANFSGATIPRTVKYSPKIMWEKR